MSAASQHLRVHAPGQLPAVVCDRHRLFQVFSNLVGNAVKHTPAGGVITLECQHRGDMLTFSVDDTGPGIAEAELPHLFDRFWQAKEARRAGAGLGLSIVKGIVEAHGGSVRVHSQVGTGTTFSFDIPILLEPGKLVEETPTG